jgi:hypothetical protein
MQPGKESLKQNEKRPQFIVDSGTQMDYDTLLAQASGLQTPERAVSGRQMPSQRRHVLSVGEPASGTQMDYEKLLAQASGLQTPVLQSQVQGGVRQSPIRADRTHQYDGDSLDKVFPSKKLLPDVEVDDETLLRAKFLKENKREELKLAAQERLKKGQERLSEEQKLRYEALAAQGLKKAQVNTNIWKKKVEEERQQERQREREQKEEEIFIGETIRKLNNQLLKLPRTEENQDTIRDLQGRIRTLQQRRDILREGLWKWETKYIKYKTKYINLKNKL